MKVAISIPEDVYYEAEELIKKAGVSRSKLYTAAIIDFVKARKHKQISETLNKLYSTQGSRLDKQVRQNQKKKLAEGVW